MAMSGRDASLEEAAELERAARLLREIADRSRADAATTGSYTPDLQKLAAATSNLIAGTVTGVDARLVAAVQLALDRLQLAAAALAQSSKVADRLADQSAATALAMRERLAVEQNGGWQ